MASGLVIAALTAPMFDFPAANYAVPSRVSSRDVALFDKTTAETAYSPMLWMPGGYSNGNITVRLVWATTVTSGGVRWDVAFERYQDETLDLTSTGFAAVQSATGTAAATASTPQYTDITFTQAQADAIAGGEAFRVSVTRDANHASDTADADAQLLGVLIFEA